MAKGTIPNIYNSFLLLIKEKGIDQVTVKDLINKCDINHKTFYYHFNSLDDLCSHLLLDELKDTLNNRFYHDNWKDGAKDCLSYLEKNKFLTCTLYKSKYWNLISRKIKTYLSSNIINTVNQAIEMHAGNGKHIKLTKAQEKYMCDFYAGIIVTALESWINSNMNITPSKYADFLHSFFNHNMFPVLDILNEH